MKRIFQYLGVILGVIFPIVCFLYSLFPTYTIIEAVPVYYFLWCGFYGCIAICFLFRSKILKGIMITFNGVFLVFVAFGSLMGGIEGLGLFLVYMVFPFYVLFV